MRYEELPGPLEGWTYDEAGTIYTASGYRCTARQIEFCMWMYDCMTSEARRWLIRSDEAPGAKRPLYQPQDLKPIGGDYRQDLAGSKKTDCLGKYRARSRTPKRARHVGQERRSEQPKDRTETVSGKKT